MTVEQVLSRLRRAILLDPSAYEEARDDSAFTAIAVLIAAAVVFATGLGAYLWALVVDVPEKGEAFVEAAILGSIFLAALWLAGVVVTYLILASIYHEKVALDALFRVSILGMLPLLLGFLVFIPGLGFGIGVLSVGLMLLLTVFGFRSAFASVAPSRIVLAVVAGFALWLLVLPLISSHERTYTPGVFLFEYTEDCVEEFIDEGRCGD